MKSQKCGHLSDHNVLIKIWSVRTEYEEVASLNAHYFLQQQKYSINELSVLSKRKTIQNILIKKNKKNKSTFIKVD
jgi:hypothetical protein